MTAVVAHTGTVVPGQDLHCFVCDVAVTGRYYTLATCRTQSTKVRLIEKLGQIVGERYMVVISEDDIICRGCATLINTLDRLETEMGSVRGVVLRFLEKKYSLEDGELVNSKPSGAPAPPPQITPSSNPVRENKSDLNRKKKDTSTDNESDGENNGENKKKSKSNTWMQCNNCKYTTDYRAFMLHHVRQNKRKAPTASVGQDGTVDEKPVIKRFKPNIGNNSDSKLNSDGPTIKVLDSGDAETVEMIAAEISDLQNVTHSTHNNQENVISAVSQISKGQAADGTTSLVMSQDPSHLAVLAGETDNGDEVTIEVSGMVMQGVSGEATMCMMPITDDGSGENIDEAEDGNVYVHVVDMSGQEVGQLPAGSVGTVGRVNEDGTVEMVEVMWDQMVADNVDGDTDENQEFTLE